MKRACVANKKLYLLFLLFITGITLTTSMLKAALFLDETGHITIPEKIITKRNFTQPKKPWTFLVYMAADNDLYPFAKRNLAQMKQVGSNENINILVHLDINQPSTGKVTKRIYIENNKIYQIGPDYKMNSGDEKTLIDATSWAINNFPSDHLAVVMWNHGSGDLNPHINRTINPAELFFYNKKTKMVELDRSIGFMEYINTLSQEKTLSKPYNCKRGICFDETNKTYLDDQKLMRGLKEITSIYGKKIDLMIFDACLMAGTGTSHIMSQFCDFMVASEEVVLGPGYDYSSVLDPFSYIGAITPKEFAHHIVKAYEKTYSKITQDYTHSAFDLSKFNTLSSNIDKLAQLLTKALQKQQGASVKNYIKNARSPYNCTYFDEPSYIDIGHLYNNLIKKAHTIKLKTAHETTHLTKKIKQTLQDGLEIMNSYIISNVCGKNLAGSIGLSIYFPEKKSYGSHHASYKHTEFAKNNNWLQFLQRYLSL